MTPRPPRVGAAGGRVVAAAAVLLLTPPSLSAQEAASAAGAVAPAATTFRACYDPAVGALYLVGLPGLAERCLKANHVAITLRGASGEDPAAATTPSGPAGGDLGGSYPNPSVTRIQGSSVASTVPANGQAMFFTAGAWRPTTPAFGGDVTGGVSTMKVEKLQNRAVSPTAPTGGQVLQWDATSLAWTPATPASGVTAHNQLSGLASDDHPQYLLASGTRALSGNLSAAGFKLTGLGAATTNGDALRFEQGVKTGDPAGGDLVATYPNPTVARLQGRPVATTAPASGQVLTWDGASSMWKPATPASGVTAHNQLTGLASDDHTQYLLTDGTRSTTNGFAVTGTPNLGAIPVTGPGTRFMWYPRKAAIRSGQVTGTEWDDASVGSWSVAFGYNPTASNWYSTALGYRSTASGSGTLAAGALVTASNSYATALGYGTTASGYAGLSSGYNTMASNSYATAMGYASLASGIAALAAGYLASATGDYSTALGYYASTNGHSGSFVWSDVGPPGFSINAPKQFAIRASGGVRLRTNSSASTGCDLAASSGVWSCTSSKAEKTDFADVDGESLLTRLRNVPVQTWRYKGEDPAMRHMGPFAEDFHAAFSLGGDSKSIGHIDVAGVSLAATKALEARTRELREELEAKNREVDALRREVEELKRLIGHPGHGRP